MAATNPTASNFVEVGRGGIGPVSVVLTKFTGTAGYRGSGGWPIVASYFGLGTVLQILQAGGNTAAQGYSYYYNTQTLKLQIFTSAGFTPAGTISVPTVKVVHSQGAGAALQILPKSVAGVLGSQDALDGADDTIPGATFGIGTQTFTGTAVAAAGMAELADATATTTFVANLIVFGT